VDNLSFEVQKGQIFGIAGPNGAGKSTVYNLITGYHSYEGKIEFDGHSPTHRQMKRDTLSLRPLRLCGEHNI
jgi:ABC-type multidrug transport system ATPase subunit